MSIDLDFNNSEAVFPVPMRKLRFKRALLLLMKRGTAEGLCRRVCFGISRLSVETLGILLFSQ